MRRLAAVLLAVVCLCLSASTAAIPASTRSHATQLPTLSCFLEVDSPSQQRVVTAISTTLDCTVTGVSTADTSFLLRYHLLTPDGATNRFSPICKGELRNGSGKCSRTFGVPYVFSPRDSWVVGSTAPSGRSLGPVLTIPILPPVTA